MSSIQSSQVPLELSFDGGATWQLLVCMTQYNMPLERSTNVVETFCGTEVGLGTLTFNPTGTAVNKTDLEANQVTYKRLLTAIEAGETIRFRVQYPGTGSIGSQFYLSGTCLVTSLDLQLQVGQLAQFAWTFTGTGTIDIIP